MNKRENTNNWLHGCTERINLLRDQYFSFLPSIDIERAISYTIAYRETENKPTIIRRANALKKAIKDKTITILPHELIVGTRGSKPRVAEITPETYWHWIKDELNTVSERKQDPYYISEEQKKILKEEVFPYWEGKSMEEFYNANLSKELRNIVYDTGIIFGGRSQCGPGTISANYSDIILKKGFKGIKKDAEKKLELLDPANILNMDKKIFLESVIVVCETMKILGERHAEKARELAKEVKDIGRKRELIEIAEICNRVPYKPPITFREAIQTIWFTQLMLYTEENSDSYCIGRLDQFLFPFYKKDIKEGKLTKLEAQELIECLWIKTAEIIWTLDAKSTKYYSGYQPFHGVTCGGLKRNDEDAVNDLSYMMVQSSMDIRLHCPSLSVRIHPETSDDFLLKAIDLISLGTGQPSLHFDPCAIKILTNKGVDIKDARDWAVVGCIEPQVPGKMCQSDEGSRYNMASAIELALFNGESKIVKRKVGLSTGDPRNFKNFIEFKEAVKKQLAYIIRQSCLNAQMIEFVHQIKIPKPLISSCVEGCVKSGTEITRGGAKYNTGPGIQATGLADLTDSLVAVKKLVFEDNLITMNKLICALEVNFEGYKDVRQLLINKAPKYGNDNDGVDYLAQELADFASDTSNLYTGIRGSKCCNGLVSVSANVSHGIYTWALPSGRLAKEPLADGCGPYMGYDKEGPTAVIKSVCKLHHYKQEDGILLNLKFNPEFFNDKKRRKDLIALIKTEMMLGGYHIQFNVIDRETLIAAQQNPKKYENLMVRVAGYSACFVDLHKEVQDSIIKRTEHFFI